MDRLLRLLVSNGFRRGFRSGRSAWFVVGAAAWLLVRARRHHDDVIYRTLLRPGERLVVVTGDPDRVEPSGD